MLSALRHSILGRFRPGGSPLIPQLLSRLGTPLEDIGAHCGTDKRAHGYLPHYQRHFSPFRDRPITVLEIGIKDGASLCLWECFFTKAQIHGLDIMDCTAMARARVHVHQGDQNNPAYLTQLAQQLGGFDIVIDDGSHRSAHVITSFNTLFPFVREGGIYVIEDLHAAYWTNFGGEWRDLTRETTSMGLIKQLADGLNHRWIPGRDASYTDENITSIALYPKVAFIQKNKKETRLREGEKKQIQISLES
ncbi:MAG: class I SAM-dependent methyltransferase [Magnetospiraceae bacterium]